MTSVLVAHSHDGHHRDVVVDGQRIARYPDDDRAHKAASLVRSSLDQTGIIPWGLLPQPLKWLGAPYEHLSPAVTGCALDERDVAGALDGATVVSDADPGL